MINECIILSGGLGTRLRSAVPELPKSMAPIAGKPFLWYAVRYFLAQGVENFVFALGYKHAEIEKYLQSAQSPFAGTNGSYQTTVEEEPLGTGGAIYKAVSAAWTSDVFIANGDTFFDVNLSGLEALHLEKKAACTLSLKPMRDFDRYGVVQISANGEVESFKEKKFYAEGLINGGIYALNVPAFRTNDFPEKFSFEKDYLEKNTGNGQLFGIRQDGYFIDIGIPSDYERAQKELPSLLL